MHHKRKIILALLIILLLLPALGTWILIRHYTDESILDEVGVMKDLVTSILLGHHIDKSIVDEAGVIKDPEPFLIEMYFLKKYSGVNFRIVTKNSLKGLSIDEAANREFARQKRATAMNPERAVLFFLALQEKSVRLKFGEELAPAFNACFLDKPFVEFIQEEQLGGFFRDLQNWEILSATLNLILMKIHERFTLPPDVAMKGEIPHFAKHLIQDEAGIIKQPVTILQNLLQLRNNFQIDFRIVTVRSLTGKDINIEANKKFDELRKSTALGRRGLLLFIAPQEELVRLEVGYELEDIFPDGFVGYIEREQMVPYFKSGQVFLGVTETIVTIVYRAAEKKYGARPSTVASLKTDGYAAGGGGAKIETHVSSTESKPEKKYLSESLKKEFEAGNTPVETLSKFLKACQRHINDPTLDIYTKESQIFLRNTVISSIELGRIAETYAGASFEEKIKGNRAVLKFKRYPPIFLKKSSQGWQIDLATMDRSAMFRGIAPHAIFDGLLCVTNPYRFAYPDFRYKVGEQPEFLTKGIAKNGPWLGVTLGFTRTNDVKGYDLVAGGFVLEVYPGSPAEKAGLRYGDIIVIINEWRGTYAELIPKIISSAAIGDKLDIHYFRNHKLYQTQAVLGENRDADYF